MGVFEQNPEETFGRIIPVATVEEKLLTVEVVHGYPTMLGYFSIVFGYLVLKFHVRDQTFVAPRQRDLQFVNGVKGMMGHSLRAPVASLHILQPIGIRLRNTKIMNQFMPYFDHIQLLVMPLPTGNFFHIGRVVNNDNGVFGRNVSHQHSFLLIAQAVAGDRAGIHRAWSQGVGDTDTSQHQTLSLCHIGIFAMRLVAAAESEGFGRLIRTVQITAICTVGTQEPLIIGMYGGETQSLCVGYDAVI